MTKLFKYFHKFMSAAMMDTLEAIVDSTSALTKECAVIEFECRVHGCGKQCKSTDEGANSFMKLCNACYIVLRSDLDDANGFEETGEDTRELQQENHVPEESSEDVDMQEDSFGVEQPNDTFDSGEQANGGSMSMEEISTALRLLVQARDARQSVKIRFGILAFIC